MISLLFSDKDIESKLLPSVNITLSKENHEFEQEENTTLTEKSKLQVKSICKQKITIGYVVQKFNLYCKFLNIVLHSNG